MTRRRLGVPASTARAAALFVAAAGLSSCNVPRNLWQAGIPSVETPLTVAKVTTRDRYLDAIVSGRAVTLRTFVPADEACAAVLVPGQPIEYLASGPYGTLRREGRLCQVVGVGSLAEWRARQPQLQSLASPAIPRAQATYRIVYRDPEFVFLRGRFPLGSRVGFAGFADTIAVVPDTEDCRTAIESEVASMQYYPDGKNVLALVSGAGLSPIEGLLLPLS